MIAFQRFCKLVKERHVYQPGVSNIGDNTFVRVPGEIYRLLSEALSSVQIFIFEAQSHEFSKTIEAELKMVKIDDVKTRTASDIMEKRRELATFSESDIDVPFKSTFFEALDPVTRNPVFGALSTDTYYKKRLVEHKVISYSGPVLIFEVSPKNYIQFNLMKSGDGDREMIGCFRVNREHSSGEPEGLLEKYLRKLRDGLLAHEDVNETIRFQVTATSPKTAKRDYAKISKIIRVIPHDRKEHAKPLFSKQIDWSHRWTVRGHWRRLEPGKLGKDRAGDYVVNGLTWVVNHIKGPDGAPLVDDKIRVVK
jgi:hypothetical protein